MRPSSRAVTTPAAPRVTEPLTAAARPARSKSEVQRLQAECAAWVASIRVPSHFHRIFDHLPGHFFFTKDARGRFMVVSRNFPHHYQLRDEDAILGLTDLDVTPAGMAGGYISDDRELLSGRKACVQRVELWFDDQGLPDWFFVTKLPLLGSRGRIIGIMGVLRRAAEHEMQIPVLQTVSRAVDWIRRHHARPVAIAEVARACGLSQRHLQRRFHETFGFSPQEFVIRTRVRAAIELLEKTRCGAAEIADRCGFGDASAFALQFRQRTGMSPTHWRRRHAPAAADPRAS